VLLGSISGGTDIISCFALSSPILPVIRGELQCRGLGMDVKSFNDDQKSVINKKGELVCSTAFPSIPLYFWNDKNNNKFYETYFTKFPGSWHHGDLITINNHGGVKIFGRSDTTLNPGGVRIGTAEIYRAISSLPYLDDSIVVGQKWKNDQRIILFIKLSKNVHLDEKIKQEIQSKIKTECSHRHIPQKIIEIPSVPYTMNGKKVELAVKQIIDGDPILNLDSLKEPEVLEYYKDIPELID
jgi:acetoacetyl-CoA synthetase